MMAKTLAAAFVLIAPLSAAAQITQGPMTIEPIGSGFVATPEVKQTEVDGRAGTLVGGSAGYVFEERVYVGGGGYWLANGSSNREMGYGGFIMQWIAQANDHVHFAAKMLIGGGTSTLGSTVTTVVPTPPVDGRPPVATPAAVPVTQVVRYHQDFLVFEPEADVHIKFNDWARLTVGGGYRFVDDYWYHYNYYDPLHDTGRLQGWVATFGVQLGGGF